MKRDKAPRNPRILAQDDVERMLSYPGMPRWSVNYEGERVEIEEGDEFIYSHILARRRLLKRHPVIYTVRRILPPVVLVECVRGGIETDARDEGGFGRFMINRGEYRQFEVGVVASRLAGLGALDAPLGEFMHPIGRQRQGLPGQHS